MRIVAQQDVFDDGQAQAGAAGVARACGVDAVETFGQVRNVLRCDAIAAIRNREHRVFAHELPGEANAAARRGVAHGIVDEVGEGAAQFFLVAGEPETGVRNQADVWWRAPLTSSPISLSAASMAGTSTAPSWRVAGVVSSFERVSRSSTRRAMRCAWSCMVWKCFFRSAPAGLSMSLRVS